MTIPGCKRRRNAKYPVLMTSSKACPNIGFAVVAPVAHSLNVVTFCCRRTRQSVSTRTKRVVLAVTNPPPPPRGDDDSAKSSPIGSVRDFLAGISRVAGLRPLSSESDLADFDVDREQGIFEDEEEPPEVLVAGATGETGRIIVRKLLFRGYRVRVLVRNLYSSTLDLLGTGVTFVKGDLSDHDVLIDCVGEVDKVVCCVGATDGQTSEEVDFQGVSNLIRAFHDSRVLHYGRAEATKFRLFEFSRQADVDKWRVIPPEEDARGNKVARVNFMETSNGRMVFLGQVYGTYAGFAEMRTVPAKISLKGFSGLILRVIGDGNPYRFILRTASGVKEGVEYTFDFATKKGKWESVRLPISSFLPRDIADGTLKRGAVKLSRSDVRQMSLQYRKPEESPEKVDGKFYLGVDYIKIYRTMDEPDFVFVSCASVTSRNQEELDEAGARAIEKTDSTAWKYMAEKRLRGSGLTYTIVRPGTFTDQPGGNKALMLEQDPDVSGVISRADVAEICVKALLDPRACNVTFDAFESMYAPTAMSPNQDMSSLLGRLRPNT